MCDTARHTEGLFAVAGDSRDEVDALADAAIAAGGTPAGDPIDHGFVYVRSAHDLDGRHWEVLHMAPQA